MDICTLEVVEAMNTKWNALGFYPGLVGGHCISVDPYYYLHEAARLGYKSEIISASRRINEGMGEYIANKTIKQMILAGKRVKGAKVGILGFTFKENCPDIRNSKVYDIYKALEQYGVQILVHDPRASYEDVVREYNVHLISWEEMTNLDAIIIAVAHQEYIEMALRTLSERCCSPCVMMDIKGIVQDQSDISCDIMYCSL